MKTISVILSTIDLAFGILIYAIINILYAIVRVSIIFIRFTKHIYRVVYIHIWRRYVFINVIQAIAWVALLTTIIVFLVFMSGCSTLQTSYIPKGVVPNERYRLLHNDSEYSKLVEANGKTVTVEVTIVSNLNRRNEDD